MNSELLSAFFNENLWTRFNVARIFEVCWHNVDDCYSCTANASHNSWIDQCIKVHPYNLFLKKRGKKMFTNQEYESVQFWTFRKTLILCFKFWTLNYDQSCIPSLWHYFPQSSLKVLWSKALLRSWTWNLNSF